MSVFFAGMILGAIAGAVMTFYFAGRIAKRASLESYEQGYSHGQGDAPSVNDIREFERSGYERGYEDGRNEPWESW